MVGNHPLLVLVVAAVLVILALLIRRLRRRAAKPKPEPVDLSLDLEAIDPGGPPAGGPQLEYYGTPVRLAVLVLAPAGRAMAFPPKEQLRAVVDRIVPGLSHVVDWHQPVYRRWPEQLSWHGFTQTFFTQVRLPGDRGKGTPWCSVAGRFESGAGPLLAGLVCRAAEPNNLSQLVIEHEGQWNDVLRVKRNEG